jgi:CRP-like cAMP-binding protein
MSTLLPENRLLAALPGPDFDRLTARMTDVTLEHKDLVYRAGGPIGYVHFPRSGVLSAVVVMEEGATAEVAAIGREGMAGASTFLGADRSQEQVFCQVAPCECRRMSAAEFAAEVNKSGALRDVVSRYLRAVLTVSARQTACNCLHSADERCARWLLECHDRAGADEFPLTHEFLSMMLGVRRATVTVTAGSLQTAGLISYHGGLVTVRNRRGLEEAACECYAVVRDAFAPPSS